MRKLIHYLNKIKIIIILHSITLYLVPESAPDLVSAQLARIGMNKPMNVESKRLFALQPEATRRGNSSQGTVT